MYIRKKNKITFLLLAMLIYFTSIGLTNKSEATSPRPSVSAHAYVIIDSKTGQVLYTKDANKKIYPASTTKMLTALVTIEKGDLSKRITVKQNVLNRVPSYASQANLKAGYSYTLEELLNMLLVYSAADAAEIIADEIAGSSAGFIKMMNERAKLLGMNNSNFDNTIGLDGSDYPKTYSTANDITKLTQYVMKNSTIRNIVKKPYYTINNYSNGSTKTLVNTNKFLRGQWYRKDLYSIVGSKTGYTDAAGYVLSTTAVGKNGREVICAFFGNSSLSKMYKDIESLLTYTFNNLSSGWSKTNDKWYYYNKSGTMKTGWLNENGTWYYLGNDGAMKTGWLNYNGSWYYLRNDGSMKTGWLNHNESWYYLRDDGSMKTGWLNHNESWYYLRDDGSMKTGWLNYNGSWYYLRDDGAMKKGWQNYNDIWYYLDSEGCMVINTIIDGWNIDSNGVATI